MNDDTTDETIAEAPATADPATAIIALAPSLEPLQALIALVTNAAACKSRLGDVRSATAAHDAAAEKAKQATAALEARQAEIDRVGAALSDRLQAISEREDKLIEWEKNLHGREEYFPTRERELHEREKSLFNRIAKWHGIERGPLQDPHNYRSLLKEILGAEPDPVAELESIAGISPAFQLDPVAGATLTQSPPRSAVARRSERRATEPRLGK